MTDVATDMIRAFFSRWSNLDQRDRDVKEDKKELMAEASSSGFNPKALRAAFTRRLKLEDTKTASALQEQEALVDLYLDALDQNPTDRTSRVTREPSASEPAPALPPVSEGKGQDNHASDEAPAGAGGSASVSQGQSDETARTGDQAVAPNAPAPVPPAIIDFPEMPDFLRRSRPAA